MCDEHPTCTADGCTKPARSGRSKYCEMHYYRLRRIGRLDLPQRGKARHRQSGGYWRVSAQGHPAADATWFAYEHRRVFYDAHGAGPFECHVCGSQVWFDDMHVDHINDDPSDNRCCNLAPACPTCNQSRGFEKMRITSRANAKQYTAHGKTMCLSEWSEHLGISRASIVWRMRNGWPNDQVFSPRQGKSGPPSRLAGRGESKG